MADALLVRNEGMEPVEFELGVAVETDFADILTVKERDFALGHPETRAARRPRGPERDADRPPDRARARLRGAERTQTSCPRPCASFEDGVAGSRLARAGGDLAAPPRRRPAPEGRVPAPPVVEVRFGTELEHVRESLAAWQMQAAAGPGRLAQRRGDDRAAPSPTSPRSGCGRAARWAASRRRDAVVHDCLRPRHDHHVPPDPHARPGARRGALEALAALQA